MRIARSRRRRRPRPPLPRPRSETFWWAHATFQFMVSRSPTASTAIADRRGAEQLYQEGVECTGATASATGPFQPLGRLRRDVEPRLRHRPRTDDATEFVLQSLDKPLLPSSTAEHPTAAAPRSRRHPPRRRALARPSRIVALGGLPDRVRTRSKSPGPATTSANSTSSSGVRSLAPLRSCVDALATSGRRRRRRATGRSREAPSQDRPGRRLHRHARDPDLDDTDVKVLDAAEFWASHHGAATLVHRRRRRPRRRRPHQHLPALRRPRQPRPCRARPRAPHHPAPMRDAMDPRTISNRRRSPPSAPPSARSTTP